jgi:hypothetical protein
MRLLHSLKSTQWVMWSSPLLLLVLVFTLSASTSSPPAHASGSPKATTSSTNVVSTTTTLAPPITTTTVRAPTTTTLPLTTNVVKTNSTSGRRVVSSSNSTDTNGDSFATAPAESASNGALRGAITPADGLDVVPLAGPGTWTLADSAPLSTTLDCSGTTVVVASPFAVGAGEDCQLTLTLENASTTVTWELTPTG